VRSERWAEVDVPGTMIKGPLTPDIRDRETDMSSSSRRRASGGSALARDDDEAQVEDGEERKTKKRPRTKSLYSSYLTFLAGYTKHPEEKSTQFGDVKRVLTRDNDDPQLRKLAEDLKLWETHAARAQQSDEKQDLKPELDALKNSLYVIFRDSVKNQAFQNVVADAATRFLIM
jgi:hypothetical protein